MMRKTIYLSLIAGALSLTGTAFAASISGTANVPIDNGNIAITIGSGGTEKPAQSGSGHAGGANIPPGHMPPPGQCRIWYHDRKPAKQPAPGKCKKLKKNVPPGASLIRG